MDKTLYKLVGERIRKARSEKELTQGELAQRLDFSAASISNIELGSQSVQLADLYRMADLLDKEIVFFLPTVSELKEQMPSIDRDKAKLPQKERELVDQVMAKMHEKKGKEA